MKPTAQLVGGYVVVHWRKVGTYCKLARAAHAGPSQEPYGPACTHFLVYIISTLVSTPALHLCLGLQ